MALTARQTALYKSLATVYRAGAKGIGWTVFASNVPCFFQPTPNYAKAEALAGRMKENNVLTSDLIHFDAAFDIRDTDIVYIQAGSERGANSWCVVVSAPRILSRRANAAEVFTNPTPALDNTQVS